jgi:hypothetical protein
MAAQRPLENIAHFRIGLARIESVGMEPRRALICGVVLLCMAIAPTAFVERLAPTAFDHPTALDYQ